MSKTLIAEVGKQRKVVASLHKVDRDYLNEIIEELKVKLRGAEIAA